MKKDYLGRKVISTLLSLVMVIVLLVPGQAVQAENNTTDETEAIEVDSGTKLLDTMKTDTISAKPNGFDEDTSSPYGTEKGEAFNMLEKNELFLLFDSSGKSPQGAYKMDNLNIGQSGDYVYSSGRFQTVKSLDIMNSIPDLVFTKCVAFDPNGEGRNTHVAVVGFNSTKKEQGTIQVYVINAEKNTVEATYTDDGSAFWMRDIGGDNKGIAYYEYGNFMDITAGDYDGDGKDSIVIYVPLNGNAYKVSELQLNGSSISEKGNIGRDTINTKFNSLTNGKNSVTAEYNARNRLGVSLTSGDFNGDGVDDLAVLSYVNRIEKEYASGDYTYYLPQLYVAEGEKTAGKSIASSTSSYRVEVGNLDTSNNKCISMNAPSVAAGDINGDGKEEIVLGGYKKVCYPGNKDKNKLIGEFNNDYEKKSIVAAYALEKGNSKLQLSEVFFEEIDSAAIGNRELYSGDHNVWQQYTTECIAFAGANRAEYMFLNGWLYTWSGKTLDKQQDFNTFNEKYKPFGDDSKENFISAVAIGNFDGNDYGQEQMFVALTCKEAGADDYAFQIVEVSANAFDEKNQTVTSFTATKDKNNLMKNKGDNVDERLNCLLAAVDYDNDSVIAKYTGKYFTYTDPSVVAVLQAAPYFDELEETEGQTTYEITESYQLDEEKASERSYSIGICSEVQAGAVATSFEGGYTKSFSESYVKSRTTSHSTAFTAGESNQIVVRRTLVYIYTYDILDQKTGKWTDTTTDKNKGMMITVPQSPVYYQMSTKTYNEFAGAYNSYVAEQSGADGHNKMQQLTILTDDILEATYLLNNEGDPYEYRSNWNKTGYDEEQVSKAEHSLGYTGQSAESSAKYEVTASDTNSKSSSDGGYFGMSLMAGGSVLGTVEAWAGVSMSFDASVETGISVTKASTETCEGHVAHVGADCTEYGFNWTFGTWKMDFGAGGTEVLCMGYGVTNQKAPIKPVTDLKGTYVEENGQQLVRLTFTEPETGAKRTQIGSYEICQVIDDDEKVIGTISANTQGEKLTYNVDVTNSTDLQVYYVVKAVAKDDTSKKSESSNEITCYLNGNGKSAYDIAVENGFDGTVEEWLASLQGTDGKGIEKIEKIKTEGLIDTYQITFTDGSFTLFTVTNGANGTNAQTPEFRFNTETRYVQWRYVGEDDAAWRNLTEIKNGIDGQDGVNGTDGIDGTDGQTPEIAVIDNMIKWRYVGEDDSAWKDIISLEELKGQTGATGEAGKGIVSIGKTSSDGTVDTYTITYSDGTTSTFTVTNGQNGTNGIDGKDGQNGTDGKNGQNGKDGTNGKDGQNGTNGQDGQNGKEGSVTYIVSDEDTDSSEKQENEDENAGTDTTISGTVQGASVNENGILVLTLDNGTMIAVNQAKVIDSASDATDDLFKTEMASAVAAVGQKSSNAAIVLASISLLWNLALTVDVLVKRKKKRK